MRRMKDTDVQNIDQNRGWSFTKVEAVASRSYNLLLKSCEWGYGRSVLSIRKVVGGTEFMIIA